MQSAIISVAFVLAFYVHVPLGPANCQLFSAACVVYKWSGVPFWKLCSVMLPDQSLIISRCNPTWLRHLTNPDLTDGWMRFPVGMVWAIPSRKDTLRLSVLLASFVCFPWLWHSARRKLPRCSHNQVRIATVSVTPPSWCRSKPLVCLDYSQVTDPGDYRLVK